MQDIPGGNCCSGESDAHDRAGVCSECGHDLTWVSRGPSAVVFECPECK
jgi:predicted RNA-binding Zn-ribbon protein involved in translation (DUF1610 family)